MSNLKKAFSIGVTVLTVLWSVGVSFAPVGVSAAATAGDLVKMAGNSAVYYFDGSKRFVFPSESTYKSWYKDFSGVKTIPSSELQSYPLGGNVTIRPGTKLVKITTDPKVYAITPGGELHWVSSESIASALYGSSWANRVVDVSDAFFVNYKTGSAISSNVHPDGTVVKYAGSSTLYYIENGAKRPFASDAAIAANSIDSANAITTTITYGDGSSITGKETNLTNVSGSSVPGPVIGGDISVTLAADSPVSSSVVAGQAIADLAHFTFRNTSSTEATVTTLRLRRIGVSADTTLTKVFLYDGAARLSDEASVSSSVMSWNNSAGVFKVPASGSKTLAVKANILTGTSGQTLGVGLQAASDVVTTATVSGTFPLNGSLMTVATATLADVSFTNSAGTTPSTNGTLDPQDGYVVWQNAVTVGQRAAYLRSIMFRSIGSVASTDVKNWKFYVDGIQLGNTISTPDANGYITFDMTASPKKLETGTRTFKVIADVIGGSNKDFTVSIRQAADVDVYDSEYNASVLVKVASAAFTTVEAGKQTVTVGSLTITKNTGSPTGNVVNNGSGVTLAKFDLKAYGEQIKIENLRVRATVSDGAVDKLRNGALFVDGVQVGSTADIYETNGTGGTYTEFSLGSSVIVTPGTTKLLEVKADIYDNDGTNDITATDTIRAEIAAGSSNLQRMVSGGYIANSAVTDASTLTVAAGSLSASKDQSYGSQTVVVPVSGKMLGKFSVTGGDTEDINMNTITVNFAFSNSDFSSTDLTNVYVKYGTKTSSLKSTVATAAAGANADNTWSISETLPKNTSLSFEVYGDIASSAYSDATADTVTTSLEITGTTANSGTTVYSGAAGANAVVAGQIITATGSGTLTVAVDSGTAVSSQVVAGSEQTDGALTLKLSASNEDTYVKKLTLRVDTSANDAVISSVDLYQKAGASGTYAKVGVTQTMNSDSTNPGYVTWNLSGTDRIKTVKDGSTYVKVVPTYVASNQVAITGQNPKFFLADLQAEGTSVLTAGGTGANLVNSTGIVLQSNTSSTFVSSTETDTAADTAAADTTLVTADGQIFLPGDIIFIDENADATWDVATEELMVVLADAGANLTVSRGAFGTTAVAYTVNTKTIYRLATATMTTTAGLVGNSMTVLKTKLGLALATDSPSGATTGDTQKIVLKFNASAANNAADPAENKATITHIDITGTKSAATIANVKVYPSEYDNNASYVTTCTALSSTKWHCVMATAGSTNEVVENGSRGYIVRADVGYSGAGNVTFSIATLGTSSSTSNDVLWSDGTTSPQWVNQSTTNVAGGSQTTTAASGSADSTGPTVSSITVAGTADNKFTVTTDTVAVVFSERMDPTLFVTTGGTGTLVPDGTYSVVTVPASTGYLSRSGANPSVGVIPGITNDFKIGGDTSVNGAQAASAVSLMLSADGTTFTIKVTTAGALTGTATAESYAASTMLATTLKDVNANALATTAATPSGDL